MSPMHNQCEPCDGSETAHLEWSEVVVNVTFKTFIAIDSTLKTLQLKKCLRTICQGVFMCIPMGFVTIGRQSSSAIGPCFHHKTCV